MDSERHWSKDELIEFMDRWKGVTIPVNATMTETQVALDLSRAFQVLDQAERLAVAECVCRKTLQNCGAPREVCLWLDDAAEKVVQNGRAKWLAKAEAKEIVRQTHDNGLVHLALTPPKAPENQPPSVLCSCCPCCCHALQGLLLLNARSVVEPSEFVATHDSENCSLCGTCIDRCLFKARSWGDEDEVAFDPSKCFGCGLCVTTCPEQAIQLNQRSI
jgi:Pyruvate/2-oxoacid:ferredoxin oxidoreductase delta subunit